MVKTGSYIVAIFILVVSTAFTNADRLHELHWEESRLLQWDDFRGQINPASSADAATAVAIRATPYRKNRELYYHVEAVFIPHRSWCKSKSEDLLSHEQLHFDIAELYARKVRMKISELKRKGIRDAPKINAAIVELLDKSNETDHRYDHETLHGAISKKQQEWNYGIQLELNLMRRYSKENWKP